MDFLILNGKIIKKEEVNLTGLMFNSEFRLKQKAWYGFGGIPLFHENLSLIKHQAELLKMPLPRLFKNTRELFRITKRLLNKNKFYRSGYVSFNIFRNGVTSDLLITSSAFPDFEFPFSEKGKLIAVSSQKKHSQNDFNHFGFFNETLWYTTLLKLHGTHFQNAVLTNEKNRVCECAFSNIYFMKNKQLITPSLNTGCFNDTLRPLILETARILKFEVIESESVHPDDIKNMDEVFLASEQHGTEWVLGFENKRFLHHHSTQIHLKLNELLKKKSAH